MSDQIEQKQGLLDWLSERLNLAELFSVLTGFGLFNTELDTTKPLRQTLAESMSKPTPSYARWPRVLTLVVVVLIGLEILTGGLLALYYLPTPQTAHASLGTLLREVQFGWLVHQVHFWGAQLLLAVLVARLARFFLQAVYRPPRELVWFFGAALLIVCWHADLTGRLLPWTATGYWSTVRALEIFAAVPIVGPALLFFVAGGDGAVTDLTLIRFYVLHVAVLPAMALGLVYLHFSCVRRVGLVETKADRGARGEQSIRINLLNLAILLTVLLGVVVSAAVLAPKPFEAAADPYATVPGIGPPWYLLAPFGLLEWASRFLPRWAAGGLLLFGTLAFLAVPLLDRSSSRRRVRPVALVIAIVLLAAWTALTFFGRGMA